MEVTMEFWCRKYKYILKTFPKFKNIEDCTAMFSESSGSPLSQTAQVPTQL